MSALQAINRWSRLRCVRWPMYAALLVGQLLVDISVSVGAWWALVQQSEARWRNAAVNGRFRSDNVRG